LTFKLKDQLRYLEENIKAPAICEVDGDIEESTSQTNIVDGDCIVNDTNTNLNENYEPINIEGTNLNQSLLAEKISNKIPSVDLPIVFEMPVVPTNIESDDDKIIKFTLNGKLKENNMILEKKNIEFEMNEIDKKTKCDFKRNEQLDASFDCILELEENTEEYYLTFKNNEVEIGEGYPNIYIKSLEQVKLINKNGQKGGSGEESGGENGGESGGQNGGESGGESGNENGNKTQNNRFYQTKKKGKSHKTLAIVLGIIAGVIVLAIIGIAIMISKKSIASNSSNLSNISSLTQMNMNTTKDIAYANKV
jgi:hypothetical protein